MAETVDNKVVRVQFDNQQFERGVRQTTLSLQNLKQSLKMEDSSKSIEKVTSALKNINLDGLNSALDSIKNRFSVTGMVALNILSSIASRAVFAGQQLVSSFTMTPLIDGLREYELQLQSLQTIYANVSPKGYSLDDVNASLDELNTYADKTIYKFGEMTRNIGTFTAAGVDLKEATKAIQGLSNLSAMTGATAEQSARGLYQVSQALSTGFFRQIDWMSMDNANMSNAQFKDMLVQIADKRNNNAATNAIKSKGSFRDSLEKQWLTKDVFLEASNILGEVVDSEEAYQNLMKKIIDSGYTEAQAKQFANMAKMAYESATKIKSFTQLVDTLKESLGTGWADIWRTVIGDLSEAKELWTGVYEKINPFIDASSKARLELAKTWKEMGGRTEVINGISNFFDNFVSIAKAVHQAWVDVFPPITAETLYNLSVRFRELSENLKPTEETLSRIGRIAKGLFSILDMGRKTIVGVAKAFAALFHIDLGAPLELLAKIGDFFTDLNSKYSTLTFDVISEKIKDWKNSIKDGIDSLVNGIKDLFGKIRDKIEDAAGFKPESILDAITAVFVTVIKALPGLITNFRGAIMNIFGLLGDLKDWIKDNISLDEVMSGISTAGLVVMAKSLIGVAKTIKEFFDNLPFVGTGGKGKGRDSGSGGGPGDIIGNISNLLNGLTESVKNMTSTIKISQLIIISTSVLMIAKAIDMLAKIDQDKLMGSFATVTAILAVLGKVMSVMSKFAHEFTLGNSLSVSMVVIAFTHSINTISKAIKRLSDLDQSKMMGSATTLAILMGVMVKVMKGLAEVKGLDAAKVSLALIAMSQAINIISKTVKTFSALDPKDLTKGVIGVTAMLTALGIAMRIIDETKISVGTSVALLAMAAAVKVLQNSVISFSEMEPAKLVQGILGIAGAMGVLVLALRAMPTAKVSVFNSLSMLILAFTSDVIANAIVKLSQIDWQSGANGLKMLAIALTEMVLVIKAMTELDSGFLENMGAVIAITALSLDLFIIAEAIKKVSEINVDSALPALGVLAGAMVILGGIVTAMGYLNPGGAILAGIALTITTNALIPLAQAFTQLSSISSDGVENALRALSTSLVVLAGITTFLGMLPMGAGLLGSIALSFISLSLIPISIAFQTLSKIADKDLDKGIKTIISTIGVLAGISSFIGLLAPLPMFGAITLTILSGTLIPMSAAFKEISSIPPDDMLTGIANMLVAVGSLAAISVPLALVAPMLGISGAALAVISGPLVGISRALADFADVGKRGEQGAENIRKSLEAIAVGSLLNTLSGFGADALAKIAPVIGDLADGVSKWSKVKINSSLEDGLKALGNGLSYLSFDDWGADVVNKVHENIGALADSVAKWSDVELNPSLEASLSALGRGLAGLNFDMLGAASVAISADSIGTLAGSIAKWNGVEIPDTLGVGLSVLAEGLNSFGLLDIFSSMSVENITGPLSELPDAIKKWTALDLNKDALDNISTGMAKIADGIRNFALTDFFSTGAAEATGNALTVLGEGVKQFRTVVVPKDIESDLRRLAEGVGEFWNKGWGADTLSSLGPTLTDLAAGIRSWSGLQVPDNIQYQLTLIANGLAQFDELGGATADNIKQLSSATGEFAWALSTMSGVDGASVASSISDLVNGLAEDPEKMTAISTAFSEQLTAMTTAITEKSSEISAAMDSMIQQVTESIQNGSGSFTEAGNGIGSAIADGISAGVAAKNGDISAAMSSAMTEASNTVSSESSKVYESVYTTGSEIIGQLASGIASNNTAATEAVSGIMSSIVSELNSHGQEIYDAGWYLADGLANGIRANQNKVVNAADAIAKAAMEASKARLQIKSPSRVMHEQGMYVSLGLANGMLAFKDKVIAASSDVASDAVSSMESNLSALNGKSYKPNISPVITGKMDGLFGSLRLGTSMRLNAEVNAMSKDGSMIVNSINNLRSDMDKYTTALMEADTSININQTNLSPKALDPSDVYRNTKNAMSIARHRG
jgi:tape measure protein